MRFFEFVQSQQGESTVSKLVDIAKDPNADPRLKNEILAKRCGRNEIYQVRAECPRNCLHPTGRYDCGLIRPVEDCHCRRGFIRNSRNQCVRPNQCGCRLQDGSGLLTVSSIRYLYFIRFEMVNNIF